NPAERLELLKNNLEGPKKLALNTVDKIHIVDIKDIIRLESHINYTQFYFKDGTKLLVTKTLKEFDKMLNEHNFIRVHQSHLIAKDQIKAFLKQNGEIQLKDESKIPVSTRKKAILMEMISKL
ncbi:MAG: LytTR family DNA-binding domain-containing protein, partial [Putridiphycobacter sp.]|nr:LytTR family DNA-binding domain-containing protein [Putridiphycobacter sp.]